MNPAFAGAARVGPMLCTRHDLFHPDTSRKGAFIMKRGSTRGFFFWALTPLLLVPGLAMAQRTVQEFQLIEEQVAYPAPETPLPADSEFTTTPSAYLQSCKTQGEVYTPPTPPPNDPRCPIPGTGYDGANCFVATPSPGTTAFVWDNKLYTTPLKNRCPLAGSYYDGANCWARGFTSDVVAGYVQGRDWYYYGNFNSCYQGTKVGNWMTGRAICHVGTAPVGTEGAFVWGTGFYYKALVATSPCPKGTWDTANCHIATPPYGATAFVWEGNLYHTPYSGPPVELWGNQLRYRGIFATIYIHGRNSAGTGPVYGWGYSGWSHKQKGTQPIWLAWDSNKRFNDSMASVRDKLDLACQGPNLPCHIVCHSAGCQMITRQLSQNPGRWNIASVTAMAGTQGGSEIASIASSLPWYIKDLAAYYSLYFPIDQDLAVSAARNMYDHNQTSGVPIVTTSVAWTPMNTVDSCKWWMWVIASPYCAGVEAYNAVATSVNNWFASIFNGSGHDSVLAYHSTAGFRNPWASQNTCSSAGYWTNYDSIHRRGYCYPGRTNTKHEDSWQQLESFGFLPP